MYIIIAQQNIKWFTVAYCLNIHMHMDYRDLVRHHRHLVMCSLEYYKHSYIFFHCAVKTTKIIPIIEILCWK